MNYPIVIAPNVHMAEWLCREILDIPPTKHVMAARTAATHGLSGMKEPVVILYDPHSFELWNIEVYMEISTNLKFCNATVIYLPEIKRVVREEDSTW